MEILRVADAQFELEQRGHGPDLVLLHSLLTDLSSFAAVVPALSRRRRVTTVSLPGFGRSTPPAGQSIEDYADRMAELFGAMGDKCDVLGNGFGGFIALALAARHGSRVDRLVLVDTGATFPEAGRLTFRAMAETVERSGMKAIVGAAVRRIFPDAYLAAHPEVAPQRAEVLLRTDPKQFAVACRALAELDLRAELGRIANSTLVVVGELDEATPPAMARDLAAGIAGARLVELPGCGHCPPLQEPAAFLAAITPFLDAS